MEAALFEMDFTDVFEANGVGKARSDGMPGVGLARGGSTDRAGVQPQVVQGDSMIWLCFRWDLESPM